MGVKSLAADTIGEYFGYQIGKLGHSEGFNYLLHKGLHGVVGALTGFILSGNKTGAISGAIGAVAAEIAIEMMVSDKDILQLE
jgi:hypothetical protein